jgi:hypothetical protein
MIDPAFEILNQRGTPMFFSDTFANRPSAGIIGRIFISIDTAAIFRDTGTAWTLISDAGAGSSNLQQVTNNGATTTLAITTGGLTATNLAGGGSQMVVVNNAGTFGVQAIPTDTNIYNSDGTLTGNRVVSLNSNYLSFAGGQTYIGSQTASTGLLTINNSSTDAHLQVVGASQPSIRIDNAGIGATQRFVMGLATATNNFIQGATAGDICISTASANPLLFGMWGTINASEAMRITTSRNLLIGSITDLGYKLYVNGSIGTNGSVTIGNGGSGTSYLYALSGSDLILNAGGDRITIRQTGNVIINNLSGSGSRMVVADATGTLSTQAIPTGTITGSGTTNYVPKFTGSSAIGNSLLYDSGTGIGIGTTTPNAKLEIIGATSDQIRLATAATEHYRIGRNASTGYLDFYGSQTGYVGYVWSGVDGQKMTLDSSGRLGVGSSSPKTILQSTGAAQTSSPTLGSATGGALYLTSTDTDYGILFGVSATGRGWIQQQRTDGTATSYAFSLQPSGGNVLIGSIIDNGSLLQVAGNLDVRSSNSFFGSVKGYVYFNEDQINSYYSLNAEATLNFNYFGYNNGITQFRNFNVYDGKGSSIFYLSGSTRSATLTGNILMSAPTGLGTYIRFTNDNNIGFDIGQLNGSGIDSYVYQRANGALIFGTNNTEKMRITNTGLVGIGTSVPDAIFHVAKASVASVGGQIVIDNNATSTLGNTAELSFLTNDGASGSGIRNARIQAVNENAGNGAANMQFWTWNGSAENEKLRITSNGNLLVGTTTDGGQKLQVAGTSLFSGNLNILAGGDNLTLSRTSFNPWQFGVGTVGGVNGLHIGASSSTYLSINETSGVANFSSNVGIGVVPSAWSIVGPVMQISSGGGFIGGQGTANVIRVGLNAYYDGSNWRYIRSDYATLYESGSGQFGWLTAPSGTNGNAITWTQIMTLTGGGNLLVGTTTNGGQRLQIAGSSFFNGFMQVTNSTGDNQIQVYGSTAPSIRIDNAITSATQRLVFGLSTATNNFIQGAVAGDICISTASNSALLFGMWGTIEAAEVMRLSTSNNVLIGTKTDSGNKLRINGSIRVDGQRSGTAGGSSGQHLIINCDGTNYKIALLNV